MIRAPKLEASTLFDTLAWLKLEYKDLVGHVGETEANKIWQSIPNRRRGKRATNPERDMLLLTIYDYMSADTHLRSISAIAAAIYKTSGGKYGNSKDAIEIHLRRLVAARKTKATSNALADFMSRNAGTRA